MKIRKIKKFKSFQNKDDMILTLGFEPETIINENFEKSNGYEHLHRILDYNISMYQFLNKEGEIYFFQKYESTTLYYTKENLELNPNDVIVAKSNYEDCESIDVSGNFNSLKKYDSYRNFHFREISEIQGDAITANIFEEILNKEKEDEIKKEKESKQREVEREQKEIDTHKSWEEDGKYSTADKSFCIDGKIMSNSATTITMSLNFNTVFGYSAVTGLLRQGHSYYPNIIEEVIKYGNNNLKDIITIDIVDTTGHNLPFNIHIENRNSSINGAKVSKNMIPTIFRNIVYKNRKDSPIKPEIISGLSNLGMVKQVVLARNDFKVRTSALEIKVPVQFIPVDTKGTEFYVELSGEQYQCKWTIIKDTFRMSRRGGYWTLEASKYFRFLEEIGIEKEKAFEIFNEAKMLEAL